MDIININKNAIEFYKNIDFRVRDFCSPLNNYLGISLFIYCKFYKDGEYLLVTNDTTLNINYIKKITYADIFYHSYLSSNKRTTYDCILWPQFPKNDCMQIYFNHGYWNGISLILDKSDEFIEMACFLSDKNNSNISSLYYKNPVVLEKFTDCFKENFAKEIEIFLGDKKLAILSNGINLYIPPKFIENDEENIQEFLKTIGYQREKIEIDGNLIKITPSTLKCLELLSQGYNIKEIAQQTNRGSRTVETLLNRVKDKTGFRYKSDLIKLYREKINVY